MYLLTLAYAFFVIQVYPTERPTPMDEVLSGLDLNQVEDDGVIAHYLRKHLTKLDLLHLPAVCWIARGIGEKIREARAAVRGQFGLTLLLPGQVWVPVTIFVRLDIRTIGCFFQSLSSDFFPWSPN